MVEICPNCYARYSRSRFVTDFVHQCNGSSSAKNNEDVPVVGNWSDYTGSGAVSPSQPFVAGAANAAQGTDAQILYGTNIDKKTERGNRKATHRTRQHLEYIDNLPPQ